MAKFFVSNTTRRIHEFSWRDGIGFGWRLAQIPIGGNVHVGGDLPMSAINTIIAHHRTYGLKSAAELPSDQPFVGLSYRIEDTGGNSAQEMN